MTNNGLNPASDIAVDFSLDGEFAEFTSASDPHQEFALLNPGASTSFNIEVSLNETLLNDETPANMVDLCLCFDSSGSMGNEIDQVKSEFLALTESLTQTISSLRIGMIVYGWAEYDQYPTEDSRNYIEFTENYQSINDFISRLEANGGHEPWGDALYLASTWTWRETASKLIIIVGDEDCDAGIYVDAGSLDTMATTLNTMGIQVNAVMTEEADSTVKQHFTMVSAETGGEMVDLRELEYGITLPDIIEEMTLSLTREFFVNLEVLIFWIENDSGGDVEHSHQDSIYLVVDLAPPSISVSTIVFEEGDSSYSLEISATPKDLSDIQMTQIIWTEDDLESNPTPLWNLVIPTTKIGDTYIETFTNLVAEQKFSFYVLATDTCGNLGKTEIFNLTIVTVPKLFGENLEFAFLEDNSTRRIYFDIDSQQTGFLWIETSENLTISFDHNIDFAFELQLQEDNTTIYKVTALNTNNLYSIVFQGNTTNSTIKVKWNFARVSFQNDFEYTTWYLHEYNNDVLLKVTLTDPEEGNLSVIVRHYSPLVLKVYVFDLNWNKLGVISPANATELSRGEYYLWAVRIVRSGEFQLYYGEDAIIDDDPYYDLGWAAATGFPFLSIIALFVLGLSGISLVVYRKRKK
ncbi:MAG: VWA domain-containing protein [Asgard group archaeon]|nr:VWA domain-containing protein [Asgard group archaeon]